MYGECSIAAVPGADGVGADDPEMIHGVRSQAGDVRTDVLIIIPFFIWLGDLDP